MFHNHIPIMDELWIHQTGYPIYVRRRECKWCLKRTTVAVGGGTMTFIPIKGWPEIEDAERIELQFKLRIPKKE